MQPEWLPVLPCSTPLCSRFDRVQSHRMENNRGGQEFLLLLHWYPWMKTKIFRRGAKGLDPSLEISSPLDLILRSCNKSWPARPNKRLEMNCGHPRHLHLPQMHCARTDCQLVSHLPLGTVVLTTS